MPIVKPPGFNQTFRVEEPTWANACVGDNGSPQISEYAAGFAQAAQVLLRAVIADEGMELHVDALIYPICFNMRHALELHLKSTVESLRRLAKMRKRKLPELDMAGTHDLDKIWAYVEGNGASLDLRYQTHLEGLDVYVRDIAAVDATGQVFRYPFDTERRKHLVEVSVINLLVLQKRFEELEERLKDLEALSSKLLDEYQWGTFTSKLSRVQLIEIAARLPQRALWTEDVFAISRNEIRDHYELSSNDFSRAICQIESRHEMASLIGSELTVPGLSSATLQAFFDQWALLHDLDEIRSPPSVDELTGYKSLDLAAAAAWHEKVEACLTALMQALTPNELASLKALFYFDRELPYSEVFERLLTDYQREATRQAASTALFRQAVRDLFVKMHALQSILRSLDFLGYAGLREMLIERYQLESVREALLEESAKRKRFVGLPS